jgi:drug/metabolite transporter (DMT)-like permease
MSAIYLLMATTLLYAGYNIFIKVSSGHVPAGAYSTITATICLQISALAVSLLFLTVQKQNTDASLVLSTKAYLWAMAAGLCIGGAEIAYFYLFAGLGHGKPMSANIAIPVVVSGTIVISLVAGGFVFKETLGWPQLLGAGMIVAGISVLFIKA